MSIVKYKVGNNWASVTSSGSIATDSTYGYVKVASDADVEAGTDNSASVTAKTLKTYSDNHFVHLTGNESIAGTKSFDNTIIRNVDLATAAASGITYLRTEDSSNKGRVSLQTYYTNSQVYNRIAVNNLTADKYGYIDLIIKDTDDYYCSISGNGTNLSLTNQTNSTSAVMIPTMGWVNNPATSTNVVHRTGDETIAGTKTFSDTIQGTAYRALWGDLAEYYLVDNQYPKGTLVQFGGEKEITIAKNKVNAVITSEPGFILNGEMKDSQAIALIGRVPVRVIGKVKKFDKIALSYIDGVGCVNNDTENPIGISLENKDDSDEGLVLCSVKIDLV